MAEARIGRLLDRLVGQRAGTGNDAYLARLVDVAGLNADLAFARGDYTWAVRTDQTHTELVALDLDFQHIQRRDALGDAYDQLDAAKRGFEDRVLAERCRYVNNRGVGASGFHGFLDRIEHRQTKMHGAALAGRHPTDHARAIGDGLLGVEGSL